MIHFVVTIRGQKLAVANAAAIRGVPFAFVSERYDHKLGWVTVGKVALEHATKLDLWRGERATTPNELLLFTTEKP